MVKKKKNYLNNADLIVQIKLSQETQKQHPDWQPSQCMTPELIKMIMLLVERYATKPNWRGYSWIEDMKSYALLKLCENALKFKTDKSKNPFGYYTQIVTNDFITFLNKEKTQRKIKDQIMMSNGLIPSYTSQETDWADPALSSGVSDGLSEKDIERMSKSRR